jgi:hypothetical protein
MAKYLLMRMGKATGSLGFGIRQNSTIYKGSWQILPGMIVSDKEQEQKKGHCEKNRLWSHEWEQRRNGSQRNYASRDG